MTESICLIVLPGSTWGSSPARITSPLGCATVPSGMAPWSFPVLLTYSYRPGLEVS